MGIRAQVPLMFHTYTCISKPYTRVYPKASGLAAWSENCKWYSYVLLSAVVSLFIIITELQLIIPLCFLCSTVILFEICGIGWR